LRVPAGVVKGVTGVVEVFPLAEPGDHWADEFDIFGAPGQVFAHFVDGVRAAQESAQGLGVEVLFGREFAGRRAHRTRIAGKGDEIEGAKHKRGKRRGTVEGRKDSANGAPPMLLERRMSEGRPEQQCCCGAPDGGIE
jgi:hypothetical protein